MKNLVFFLVLLLAGTLTQAINVVTPKGDVKMKKSELVNIQLTSLSGVVLDHETGEALVGVAIRIEGSEETIYTDFDGNFTLQNVIPGKYNLISNYISYTNNKLKNVNISGENNVIRMLLKKD